VFLSYVSYLLSSFLFRLSSFLFLICYRKMPYKKTVAVSFCESIADAFISFAVWMVINLLTAMTITFLIFASVILVNYILTTNSGARCAITSVIGAVTCPERHFLTAMLDPSSSCAWYATVRDTYCPQEEWKMFGV